MSAASLTISKTVEQERAFDYAAHQRAEKDARREDNVKFSELGYAFSLFLMGVAFYLFDIIWIIFSIISVIIWRNVFHDALKLRGVKTLSPRSKVG